MEKQWPFFCAKLEKKIKWTNFNEIGSLDFLCILIWEEWAVSGYLHQILFFLLRKPLSASGHKSDNRIFGLVRRLQNTYIVALMKRYNNSYKKGIY